MSTFKIKPVADDNVLSAREILQAFFGAALIESVKNIAKKTGCRQFWLITTNDNIPAIEFYKRRVSE